MAGRSSQNRTATICGSKARDIDLAGLPRELKGGGFQTRGSPVPDICHFARGAGGHPPGGAAAQHPARDPAAAPRRRARLRPPPPPPPTPPPTPPPAAPPAP